MPRSEDPPKRSRPLVAQPLEETERREEVDPHRARPKRRRPLVAQPVDEIDLREPTHDQPEVIDLRGPEPLSWEDSAALIQLPDDLDARIADRRRDTVEPGDLRASPEDVPDVTEAGDEVIEFGAP